MNTMTPMEQDAFRQGQTAARCGLDESANPHWQDATNAAWREGYKSEGGSFGWRVASELVAPAPQECETPELFLPA